MVSLQTNVYGKIDKVQMRATRMVRQLKNYSYEARLRLNLPTLKYRRLRGDMIQVFNIVSGKYTINPTVDLNLSNFFNTRGNIYKMQLTRIRYILRKHFFSNRIIVVWNSLPNIIVNAESTNIFENRLDRFWVNQKFKFDRHADFDGIGSQSANG